MMVIIAYKVKKILQKMTKDEPFLLGNEKRQARGYLSRQIEDGPLVAVISV